MNPSPTPAGAPPSPTIAWGQRGTLPEGLDQAMEHPTVPGLLWHAHAPLRPSQQHPALYQTGRTLASIKSTSGPHSASTGAHGRRRARMAILCEISGWTLDGTVYGDAVRGRRCAYDRRDIARDIRQTQSGVTITIRTVGVRFCRPAPVRIDCVRRCHARRGEREDGEACAPRARIRGWPAGQVGRWSERAGT